VVRVSQTDPLMPPRYPFQYQCFIGLFECVVGGDNIEQKLFPRAIGKWRERTPDTGWRLSARQPLNYLSRSRNIEHYDRSSTRTSIPSECSRLQRGRRLQSSDILVP
jgi:ribosomal protein S30